jgi:GcrA cell cycle regulator
MIANLWTPEKIALLKELWALGLPASQISEIMAERKMPSPKNALYKKARRLGLPPREIVAVKKQDDKSAKSKKPVEVKKQAPEIVAPEARVFSKYEGTSDCCWPLGDPRKPDFRFCGKKRVGRNYCDKHEKMAYCRP